MAAKDTHESIRRAICQHSFSAGVTYDTYLQGSYRNSTNIIRDSDVDLVVELTSSFCYDVSALSYEDACRFEMTHFAASYHWSDFLSEVYLVLSASYGADLVQRGHKSIKVAKGNSNRLNADVLVCMTHRKYLSYPQYGSPRYVEGITFLALPERRQIINYPKLHYDKGAAKNEDTRQRFKPAVRMFKNARSYMVENGLLAGDIASSYFIECLAYNMPSSEYAGSWAETYLSLIGWFCKAAQNGQLASLRCQNGISPLFGDLPEQWSANRAFTFIDQLLSLYRNW